MRKIDDQITVSPQIGPAELADVAAAGFVAVINNRPDGEESGQPDDAAMRAVAEGLGLAYHAIPITQAGFSMPQVDAMRAAMDAADGPVFAYCRSGTRSTNLWALAQASSGEAADPLIEKAAGAGYDIRNLRPMLDALAAKA